MIMFIKVSEVETKTIIFFYKENIDFKLPYVIEAGLKSALIIPEWLFALNLKLLVKRK